MKEEEIDALKLEVEYRSRIASAEISAIDTASEHVFLSVDYERHAGWIDEAMEEAEEDFNSCESLDICELRSLAKATKRRLAKMVGTGRGL